MNVNEDYEIINGFCIPAYSYIELDEHEKFWVDSENCHYNVFLTGTDKYGSRNDGKKYWIIEPHRLKEMTIKNKKIEEIKPYVKWIVTISSEETEEGKEWDFDNHCTKN